MCTTVVHPILSACVIGKVSMTCHRADFFRMDFILVKLINMLTLYENCDYYTKIKSKLKFKV